MRSVRDIVRPFAETEFDKWMTEALQGSFGSDITYPVFCMDYWVETALTKPVRRAVFWPLTNFLSGLFKEEFYGEDS